MLRIPAVREAKKVAGVELEAKKRQTAESQEGCKSDGAFNTQLHSQFVGLYCPILAKVDAKWGGVPESIRQAILAIVEAHHKEFAEGWRLPKAIEVGIDSDPHLQFQVPFAQGSLVISGP